MSDTVHYPALWDSNGGHKLLWSPSVNMAVTVIIVGLRLWSRKLHGNRLALNDYTAVLGLFFTIGVYINTVLSVVLAGNGHHYWDIEPDKRTRLWKYLVSTQILASVAVTTIRFSITHLYLEIFPSKKFRIVCYAWFIFSLFYGALLITQTFIYCRPIAYIWDKTISGKCRNPTTDLLGAACSCLVIDTAYFILPMPMLWRLNVPLLHRIGVTIMFCFGLAIFATDAQRVASYVSLARIDNYEEDFGFYGVTIAHIAILEPQFSLESACIPIIRPVLQMGWDLLARAWPKKWKRHVDDKRPPWFGTWLSATNRQPSTINISIKIDHAEEGEELSPLGGQRCPSGLRNSMLESVADGDLRKSYHSTTEYDLRERGSLDIQPV